MKQARNNFFNKFSVIEIVFFLFYYFLFGILTDIEYDLTESVIPAYHHNNIGLHLISGLVTIIPVWVLYKIIIQKYLFKKVYLKFVLGLIAYLVLLNFYNVYINLLITKMTFLPVTVTDTAYLKYHAKVLLHFGGTMYMIREYLVLFALAFFIQSLKQDDQLKALKEQQLSSELNYLKAQLHPHFFFNTINNIYSLALKQSADTAPVVARLGEMMRYILYEANQKVLLSREIAFLTNYIEVEKIRHFKAKTIHFDFQAVEDSLYIEPLLLLPFIENAFKHGLQEETGGGFVNIIVCLAEKELTVEVSNSKPEKSQVKAKGIGLQNAIKRLDILYPGKYHLDIKNEKNIYKAFLTLQMA